MRPVGTALLRRLPCEQHEPWHLAVLVSTPLLLSLPSLLSAALLLTAGIWAFTRRAH